jgi:hypothetical protein
MGHEKPGVTRGVHIFGSIGMAVVMAMDRSPPEDAALRGGLPEEGDDKLEKPARLVGAVREVPVKTSRQRPHPDEVQYDAHDDREGREPRPKDPDEGEVDEGERDSLRVNDIVVGLVMIVVVVMTVSMLVMLGAHGRLKLG